MNQMKNIQFIVLILLIILSSVGNFFIVQKGVLQVEYKKVGGEENFKKITKIQLEQIEKGLQEYDNQGGNEQQAGNDKIIEPSNNIISLDTIAKIKEGTYILGNPEAEITFIEYSDLECPFCKRLHESGTIEEVLEAYNGNVNFIFKQFPLSFHAMAPMEAEAALCVGELGGTAKYYSFITEVFKGSQANGRSYTKESVSDVAGKIGVDSSKVLSCIESGKMKERADAEMKEGANLFGITGTPGNVLINNKTGKWDKLPGAYPTEAFKAKIDSLLK